MLYVPLVFENGLTIDALVDSGAYVSAIAQEELNKFKQQAPSSILRIDDPPKFLVQAAIVQFEKPVATARLTGYCKDWNSHLCRTLCGNEEFDMAHFRFALHKTQQCGHRFYTWPHSIPSLDNASKKSIERSKC